LRAFVVTLATLGFVGVWAACSDAVESPPASVPDSGSGDAVARDARSDVVADREAPDPPRPAWVPEGWILDRTYDKSCSFWVPEKREQLPPPIQWEPCPSTATPPGITCEVMKAANPAVGVSADAAWMSSTKGLVFAIAQPLGTMPSASYRIIAAPEGQVFSAILSTDYSRCGFTAFPDGAGDHYALNLLERGSSGTPGALLGRLDAFRPTGAIHISPSAFSAGVYASHFGAILAVDGTWTLNDWDSPSSSTPFWSEAQDDKLQQHTPSSTQGAVFWTANRLYRSKVNVYTEAKGVRAFLDPGAVSSPGYGSLGTDGTDLVWIKGEGRTQDPNKFDTLSIMTAPFTTDPNEVVPRRLRSEEGVPDVRPFAVGCGYAAGEYGDYFLRVVRLSDGVSWKLDGKAAAWRWSRQLAVTCDHVYAVVHEGTVRRLARVRINSLGAGLLPD